VIVGVVVAVAIVGGLIYTFGSNPVDRPQPGQGSTHQITDQAPPTRPASSSTTDR
jgi:hypothetical protein